MIHSDKKSKNIDFFFKMLKEKFRNQPNFKKVFKVSAGADNESGLKALYSISLNKEKKKEIWIQLDHNTSS